MFKANDDKFDTFHLLIYIKMYSNKIQLPSISQVVPSNPVPVQSHTNISFTVSQEQEPLLAQGLEVHGSVGVTEIKIEYLSS